MDQALTNFISWHTLVFGLACWILTFLSRRITETALPHLKKQVDANQEGATYKTTFARWWNEVLLYVLPVAWGGLSASLATFYPFPEGVSSFSARLFFGIVTGFFSGFIYKILKKIILKKFDIVSESDLPAAKVPEHVGDG
jgi:hypothetical protein